MLLLSWTGETCAQTKPVYLDESKSIEQRVEDALSRNLGRVRHVRRQSQYILTSQSL